MTLVWLARQVVPFGFPPGYYRVRTFEVDGRLYRRLGVVTSKRLLFNLQRHNRARLLPVLEKLGGKDSPEGYRNRPASWSC